MEFHNLYIWISNICLVFVIMSTCGRTVRLTLLYYLNVFKAECILHLQNFNENPKVLPPKVEVNSYIKAVDYIIKKNTGKWVLIISVIITATITIISEFVKSIYSNKPTTIKMIEFAPINAFMIIYILICIYFIYSLRNIKDNEIFGIKFEVICSFITSLIVMIITIIMNVTNNRFLMEITHSGSYLYIIQTFICHFASVTIPVIASFVEENKFKKQSKVLSLTEFSKLLYKKSVINDLKIIAVNDFCVENILFWETYIKLKELTYQCLTNTGIFEKTNVLKEENKKHMDSGSQYLCKYVDRKASKGKKYRIKQINNGEYEPYYDYIINASQKNNKKYDKNDPKYYQPRVTSPFKDGNKNYFIPEDYKNYDIDPNIPLDYRLVPYYISFYKAFIDPSGPVNVFISSDIASNILKSLSNNPTVGILDEAKSEVIMSMFLTLYPKYINLLLNG